MTYRGCLCVLLLSSLAACDGRRIASGAKASTGADADEYGGAGPAGFRWCERLEDCVRPWELAAQAEFEPAMRRLRSTAPQTNNLAASLVFEQHV